MGYGHTKGTEAMPGRHVGGYSDIVHGKTMKHAKFGGASYKEDGHEHEVFRNEGKHSSTHHAHAKFYAHMK